MKGSGVTVVICTYDMRRWEDLRAAVDSLRVQTVQPREVLVVVDHNPGVLARVQAELPGVEVVENAGPPGLSSARNSGLAAAAAAIVAFLDDDAVAAPEWLERLSAGFTGPRVVAVGGATDPLFERARPGWLPDEFDWVVGASYRGLPAERAETRNVFGGNMAVRRDAALAIGGFNHSMGRTARRPLGCEETELCIKLTSAEPGRAIVYEPAARIGHKVGNGRCRLRYFMSRCFFEGRSKAALASHVARECALSSERVYAAHVLPAGIVRHVRDALGGADPTGLARAGAIVLGFASTGAGFVAGTFTANNRQETA